MSVILDALRRARGATPAAPAAIRQAPAIPAGLRVGTSPRPKVARGGKKRWVVIALAAILAVAVVVSLRFGRATPAVPLARSVPAVSPPPAAVPAPQPVAPAPAVEVQPTPEETAAAVAAPVPAPRAPARRRPAARVAPTPRPLPATPAPALTQQAVAAAAPTPEVNHFDLAVRYQSLGNFEQALTHYTAVLQADEFNVEARNNLGLLYHERRLTGEAVEQFRRAILISPEYLKARGNLSVVLMDAGRLAEARAELRAALAIDPRNVDLLVNMALVEKADRQPAQAKEILLRAIGYQPTHAAAHYNLAVLYDEAGEMGQAYDHYTDFLKSAGPEYGARLSDVRRRVDAIESKLDAVR